MQDSRTAWKQQGGRGPHTTSRVDLHDEGLEHLDCPDLSRRHDANWERNESHEAAGQTHKNGEEALSGAH